MRTSGWPAGGANLHENVGSGTDAVGVALGLADRLASGDASALVVGLAVEDTAP